MTVWESLESKNSLLCPLQAFSLYFNGEATKNVNPEKNHHAINGYIQAQIVSEELEKTGGEEESANFLQP